MCLSRQITMLQDLLQLGSPTGKIPTHKADPPYHQICLSSSPRCRRPSVSPIPHSVRLSWPRLCLAQPHCPSLSAFLQQQQSGNPEQDTTGNRAGFLMEIQDTVCLKSPSCICLLNGLHLYFCLWTPTILPYLLAFKYLGCIRSKVRCVQKYLT